jgi:hypothetical protein
MTIRWQVALLLSLAAVVFQSCSALGRFVRRNDPPPGCSQTHYLEAVSLSIYPDPLPDARQIDGWRLRVRSDSPEECRATIRIVEVERNLPAAEGGGNLILGVNDIKLSPVRDYRFAGDERCFNVVGESQGNKVEIKGPEAFCALHIDKSWWTMR